VTARLLITAWSQASTTAESVLAGVVPSAAATTAWRLTIGADAEADVSGAVEAVGSAAACVVVVAAASVAVVGAAASVVAEAVAVAEAAPVAVNDERGPPNAGGKALKGTLPPTWTEKMAAAWL